VHLVDGPLEILRFTVERVEQELIVGIVADIQ